MNLVDAQQARRVLDRIVGYKISPVLWKKVKRGLSAGRVQSAALKLIVDHEKEIDDFVPEEYWIIEVKIKAKKKELTLTLDSVDGKPIKIKNQAEAEAIFARIPSILTVTNIEKKIIKY